MTSTELKHQARLQDWAVAIQECRSSGLSVKQWCRQQGITATTYYRWERELLALTKVEGNAPKGTVSFVELPPPKQQDPNVSERVATIRISDASIDIYGGATSDILKTLVETLRSC